VRIVVPRRTRKTSNGVSKRSREREKTLWNTMFFGTI
jgi:hypothetical protein